jgi:hypothetical protein
MEQSPSREANNSLASQEIPPLYDTRMFIFVFTRARHWFLCWAGWRYIQLSSSHLAYFCQSVWFRFSQQKPLCISLLPIRVHATFPVLLILLDFGHPNKIYLARSINHNASHYALLSNLPVTSSYEHIPPLMLTKNYVCVIRLNIY